MLSEKILFILARALYKTEIAHSSEMKKALMDHDAYHSYRSKQINRIIATALQHGICIFKKDLLELGCNDGAMSSMYLDHGASSVIGIDIDEFAIERANKKYQIEGLTFITSTRDKIPIGDESVDTVISYDVFEHVSNVPAMTGELYRILRPKGQILIGTQGWRHPYSPHLWSTMPVPWAHILFSEKTVLRVCRRVYNSNWYVPNMHDLDIDGNKLSGKFTQEEISRDYLNKFLIRNFEEEFALCGFGCKTNLVPFSSKYASFTRFLLRSAWLREFFTSYVWFVLTKP